MEFGLEAGVWFQCREAARFWHVWSRNNFTFSEKNRNPLRCRITVLTKRIPILFRTSDFLTNNLQCEFAFHGALRYSTKSFRCRRDQTIETSICAKQTGRQTAGPLSNSCFRSKPV
jgi:hypothetical protein